MSKEFYKFIAKEINSYFQTIASNGDLQKGETFCLKLDNEEMVQEVHEALENLLKEDNNIGKYYYHNNYSTFTIKVEHDIEVIVASQINGMTSDFLCATLRNVANEEQKPLLMIATNFIDSAKSSARDLSANGNPFHADKLKRNIKEKIGKNEQLSDVEKIILSFVLDQQIDDYDSISDYENLITIIQNGEIKEENFASLKFFPINGKRDYQDWNQKDIDKDIKENNKLFEEIENNFQSGNLDLSEYFGDSDLISEIEKAQRDSKDNWSKDFPYKKLKKALSKQSLKIEDQDIAIYRNSPQKELLTNFIIRNDGTTSAKQKKKNIFIFNQDSYLQILVQISCNIPIDDSDIKKGDAKLENEGKYKIFTFTRKGITFHQIEIKKYVFKICIMDIPKSYLFDTQKYYSIINFKPKKDRGIKIIDSISNLRNLSFNSNAQHTISKELENNATYQCSYDQRLEIRFTNLLQYEKDIKFNIDFSGLTIPFLLEIDELKPSSISGQEIFRDKLAKKTSFQFDYEKSFIFIDSQKYSIESNLLRELQIEQKIIDEEYFYGICTNFYDFNSKEIEIQKIDLQLTDELRNAYLELLKAFQEKKTIPTLAYLKDEKFYGLAVSYINAFEACFNNLQEEKPLTDKQKNALLLGTLFIKDKHDFDKVQEILYTPFHPLNIKYQLELLEELKEHGIDSDSKIADRLNSVNLLPYINYSQDTYKVSENLYSQEWKYYAPVENRKYRGSRKYVSNLVKDKISEFISHFKYMFDDINNSIVRINLINMGDCSQVFLGLVQYFINNSINKLFKIHIYGNNKSENVFNNIKDYGRLNKYLNSLKESKEIDSNISLNDLSINIAKNIECYFYEDSVQNYEYAQLSFYEMESSITSGQANMNDIETGISLGGLISGTSSSKYTSSSYRTGFALKYAEKTSLIDFAKRYNSLMLVSDSDNPYSSTRSISIQIDKSVNQKIDFIYKKSNWVVFVDPKVDLEFFRTKEDLLIIHYSDQYTSSSGYDAITVTQKSKQYAQVIKEYLKGYNASDDNVHKIINLFNAINGDWLLRVISSKSEAKVGNYFSREKISILAAVQYVLAWLKCQYSDMIWIPISLEEILRVSRVLRLSLDSIFSDDLLFIGIKTDDPPVKIYLYPVEVKTGDNQKDKIEKAFTQVKNTTKTFRELFNSETIENKVKRNFLMQMLVTSCKKMKVYHVDDFQSQSWDVVLDKYREALLNEKYCFFEDCQKTIGKGLVFSFKKDSSSNNERHKANKDFKFIEIPENKQVELILKNIDTISDDIKKESLEETETCISIKENKVSQESLEETETCIFTKENKVSQEEIEETENNAILNENEQISSIEEDKIEMNNTMSLDEQEFSHESMEDKKKME